MTQPNCVVVVADDMGYGDLGLFNDGRCATPNLDRMASEGLCLTQHYSGSPVCAPSRAALLTGKYPHRTGAIDTLQGRGLDRIGLGQTTLADVFRQAGYRTGLLGKWHNGALDPRFHPNARGFEEFVGFCGGYCDYYEYYLDLQRLGAPRRRAVSDRRAQRAGGRLRASAPGRALPSRPRTTTLLTSRCKRPSRSCSDTSSGVIRWERR